MGRIFGHQALEPVVEDHVRKGEEHGTREVLREHENGHGDGDLGGGEGVLDCDERLFGSHHESKMIIIGLRPGLGGAVAMPYRLESGSPTGAKQDLVSY